MADENGLLETLKSLQQTIAGLSAELQESRREMVATAENLRWVREQGQADGERIRALEQRLTVLESEGRARSGSWSAVASAVSVLAAVAAVVVSLVT